MSDLERPGPFIPAISEGVLKGLKTVNNEESFYVKLNLIFELLRTSTHFIACEGVDDGCDILIHTMTTNPKTFEETEAIARYFYLFHGDRFEQLRTFMGLYPSRFKEPFDLPLPEEIVEDDSDNDGDDDSTVCKYKVVSCSEINYIERQRTSRVMNVKIGRGVIIAMPIDLNAKCSQSTNFVLEKLILYEYWNHDTDFGLAIECFDVFKERNTDSELVMQGLDGLDAERVAYKPFPMQVLIKRSMRHLREPKNKAKRRGLMEKIGKLLSRVRQKSL